MLIHLNKNNYMNMTFFVYLPVNQFVNLPENVAS